MILCTTIHITFSKYISLNCAIFCEKLNWLSMIQLYFGAVVSNHFLLDHPSCFENYESVKIDDGTFAAPPSTQLNS